MLVLVWTALAPYFFFACIPDNSSSTLDSDAVT